ncbi:hypothetical protein GY45DRAFT_222378 [Cubamyces sp. BRFM 1775]|nr:hypothetical protein GY45DRAFT_222378 [Cubamyces sp. BRFM 1775]
MRCRSSQRRVATSGRAATRVCAPASPVSTLRARVRFPGSSSALSRVDSATVTSAASRFALVYA